VALDISVLLRNRFKKAAPRLQERLQWGSFLKRIRPSRERAALESEPPSNSEESATAIREDWPEKDNNDDDPEEDK
jgi:hypothetical protein